MGRHAIKFSTVIFLSCATLLGGEPGVVCHVSVTSDKVPDVSNLEAWKMAFITDGMSDKQKALAIWKSVTTFKQQDIPPLEFVTGDGGDVHDAIKTFNVYGYGLCCCASSNMEELSRYVGLKARGWGINGHSVSEVYWDKGWHLLDSALVCYWPKAAGGAGSDGDVASVDELIAGVNAWYEKNPDFKAHPEKLQPFAQANGWKKGPDVFSHTSCYTENGALVVTPWHGWWANMEEYNGGGAGPGGKAVVYDYGYSQGYQLNLQLRPGERLTRNWSNRGLDINMDGTGGRPLCLKMNIGEGFMAYSRGLGDLANQRIGNGTTEYDVPLASGKFRGGALTADNLSCTADDHAAPAVHVKDAAQLGVLVIRMPSSYVYLGGTLAYGAVIGNGGSIAVQFSDNNGLDWKDLAKPAASGPQTVDLKPLAYRRYDYRLKFVLSGAGTGIDKLAISHDIQHSQRALPALDKGANTIHIQTGAPESTITIEANQNLDWKAKQLVYTDFHPAIAGLKDGGMRVAGGDGSITFPIATPGDMKRLRFGCNYRARDEKDGWDMQVSIDGGKTFTTVDRAPGLTGNGSSKYVVFDKIPAGTKDAQVRFVGTQRNTTMISFVRIDADYAVPQAGFLPVQITYAWKENGQVKKDVHVAQSADETYVINCAEKPVMTSVEMDVKP